MDGAGLRRSPKTQADSAASGVDHRARAPHHAPRRGAAVARSIFIAALRALPALLLLLAGCDGSDSRSNQPTLVEAVVAFPPRDTIRFSLPATAHRCADPRTILI